MNVLFITADQWRGECFSHKNHLIVRTPHLDALAKESVVFEQHYAQTAPCGPSRASLLTGTYLHRHRSSLNGTPLDKRFTTIALEARKLGYKPALFGYTDTSVDPTTVPSDDPRLQTYEGISEGFDNGCFLAEDFRAYRDFLRSRGYVDVPELPADVLVPVADYPGTQERGRHFAPTPYPAEDSETSFLCNEFLRWSDQQTEPWFAHLSIYRPHPPFYAPAPFNAMYDPHTLAPPTAAESLDAEAAVHPYLRFALSRPSMRAKYATEEDFALQHAQMRAAYYGLMSHVDDVLGKVIQHLKRTGAYENTFIVFTSDHGEMLGDHWLAGKLGFFDEAYHIPLIVRDPRTQANSTRGSTVRQFTENIDIMPTILQAIGATAIPLQCQGASLLPWLLDQQPVIPWRTDVHWEYEFRDPEDRAAETMLNLRGDECGLCVLRNRTEKYVHFTALPPLYYDLQADPQQLVNRASDPEYMQRVLACAQRMLSWRMNHEENVWTRTKLVPGGPITSHD